MKKFAIQTQNYDQKPLKAALIKDLFGCQFELI